MSSDSPMTAVARLPGICVVCGESYETLDHHCDPRTEARILARQREAKPRPIEFGKSFHDRLRDAEIMLTLVETDA
jgi:hypothetical protein